MKLLNWFSLILLSLVLVGCGKREIIGTEKIAAQNRNVARFTSLNVSGYYNINITIGQPQSVVVKVNANLLSYIDTTVKGKRLTVQSKKGYLLRPQGIPEIDIVVPELSEIVLSGNNNATLKSYVGDSLELNFAGSNQIVAEGKVNTLRLDVAGNSGADIQRLVANKVKIDSNGNSKMAVNAKNNLDITIAGNAVVTYIGNPKLTQKINGSGTISKLQETINK